MRAPVGGKVIDQDTLDGESLRASVYTRQEPSDVELKNPVRVVLITRLDKTGLKVFVTFEPATRVKSSARAASPIRRTNALH
jgi:hypothetical protein